MNPVAPSKSHYLYSSVNITTMAAENTTTATTPTGHDANGNQEMTLKNECTLLVSQNTPYRTKSLKKLSLVDNSANLGDTLISSMSNVLIDGGENLSREVSSSSISEEDTSTAIAREEQSEEHCEEKEQKEEQMTTPPCSNQNISAFMPPLEENDEDCSNKQEGLRRSNLCEEGESSSLLLKLGKTGFKRRRVTFSMVQIRRYPMILGDNPATPSGPPISLGWEYETLPAMNIMDFESFRMRSRRFHTSHMILSHYKRMEIVQKVSPAI
jgi:hypothetical protein